jgi:hypothetical protein
MSIHMVVNQEGSILTVVFLLKAKKLLGIETEFVPYFVRVDVLVVDDSKGGDVLICQVGENLLIGSEGHIASLSAPATNDFFALLDLM